MVGGGGCFLQAGVFVLQDAPSVYEGRSLVFAR